MSSRSYHQFCALARALDVVGDRWSPLIIRNLLLGSQRWKDLKACLPGIATNLLAARLSALEENGILTREDGDDGGYVLTERGQELERALFALADWGEKHFLSKPDAGDAIRLRYFMTSLRRKLRPTRKRGWIQCVVSGESYSIRLGRQPTVVQGLRESRTAVHSDFGGLRRLFVERVPPARLVERGAIAVSGDLALIEELAAAL